MLFASASSQLLQNTATSLPTTGYPLIMGGWFYVNSVATAGTLWGMTANAATNAYLELNYTTGALLHADSDAAGVVSTAATTSVFTVNTWNFAVMRMVSATNRWVEQLLANGTYEAVQNTTSSAPATLNTVNIGGRAASTPASFSNGWVGEFWYATVDPADDSTTSLGIQLMQQLAYQGPFSVPKLVPNIVEYRSLRTGGISGQDQVGEVYGWTQYSWTSSASVPAPLYPQPPLPLTYLRPLQRRGFLNF